MQHSSHPRADRPAAATWEQAVRWLRGQPHLQGLARDCYYDDPLEAAAERFWLSEEWRETRALCGPARGQVALDLGAGRGIASHALARDGWRVTALEPDTSPLVGTAAIQSMARCGRHSVQVVRGHGEALPFVRDAFGLVYGRAVLHHARNLPRLLGEVARVLKPGGRAVFTREHVIAHPRHRQAFLDAHPLHWLYGGENAYTLTTYMDALQGAALRVNRCLAPLESVINFFPVSEADMETRLHSGLRRFIGGRLAHRVLVHPRARSAWLWLKVQRDPVGRLYSFVAEKP